VDDEGLFAFRMHAGLLLKPEKYKPEMDWVKAMSALDSPRLSMPAKTSGLPGLEEVMEKAFQIEIVLEEQLNKEAWQAGGTATRSIGRKSYLLLLNIQWVQNSF